MRQDNKTLAISKQIELPKSTSIKRTSFSQSQSQRQRQLQKDKQILREKQREKQQLEESNPFRIQIKQAQFEKEGLQNQNPFKMEMKPMAISNPFEIKLNQPSKEQLFFRERSQQKQQQFFNKIAQQSPTPKKMTKGTLKQHSFSQHKLAKGESKYESTHMEQYNKKYKDILRLFYNNKYCHRVKNFQQSWRKFKKESSSGGPNSSQELRKPEMCFKATRLAFNKESKTKTNSYQKQQQFYLVNCSYETNEIIIYQLKHPNVKSLKPMVIKINCEQKISSSVEYDPVYGRIFVFSNSQQEILVISTKSKEVICRMKVKHERTNPLLHINKYKTSLYLLVIGGYRIIKDSKDSIVEGSKYVEIFSIDKWQISLKQVILRLGIGRISPIVFCWDHDNEQCIFILGGCSNATLTRKKQLTYTVDEDINFSTNQTAVKIDSSFVEECFVSDQSSTLLVNNINVRFENPTELYAGTVLFRKLARSQKLELFLPGKSQIYAIKTLKNDVHIIQSQLQIGLWSTKTQALNKSIGYHRDLSNFSQLYRIDRDGKLVSVQVKINQKKSKIKEEQQGCRLI